MGGTWSVEGGKKNYVGLGPKGKTTPKPTTTTTSVRPRPTTTTTSIAQYKDAPPPEGFTKPKPSTSTTSVHPAPTTTTTIKKKTGADIIGGAIESAESRKRQLEEIMKE